MYEVVGERFHEGERGELRSSKALRELEREDTDGDDYASLTVSDLQVSVSRGDGNTTIFILTGICMLDSKDRSRIKPQQNKRLANGTKEKSEKWSEDAYQLS